jgi:hypothetical protein
MVDLYTVHIHSELPALIQDCLDHSRKAVLNEPEYLYTDADIPVMDIRVWMQLWQESSCGLNPEPGLPGRFIAPTVIIKYTPTLRYVYFNGYFAYRLKGRTAIPYYDAVRNRSLPPTRDLRLANLLG